MTLCVPMCDISDKCNKQGGRAYLVTSKQREIRADSEHDGEHDDERGEADEGRGRGEQPREEDCSW